MQVRRHLESEDCLVTGRVRALRLDLRADLNRPSATLSNSALLRPRRSRTTCKNAGLHSGERSIADKDEVGGSSPPRPTIRPPTSGNATQPLERSQLLLISKESTRVEPFQKPHGSYQRVCWPLGSLPRRRSRCTAVVQRITSRADGNAARLSSEWPRASGCSEQLSQR